MRVRTLKNRIQAVGIELEGGWRKLPSGVQLVHDGSVRFDAYPPEVREALDVYPPTVKSKAIITAWQSSLPKHVGELPSAPMKVEDVRKWMLAYHPSHVNETCGLHVHMSFTSLLNYQRLMTADYLAAIVKGLMDWGMAEKLPQEHPLWARLAGKSEYCQAKFMPDAQAALKAKAFRRNDPVHRYTIVNYCHGTHSTIEIRVLPMFADPEQSTRAVEAVLRITNTFLATQVKKERPVQVMVEDTLDSLCEVINVSV